MLNLQGFSYFCAKEGAVALADLIGQLCDSPFFECVPGMAQFLRVKVPSRVVTAKCSEPQAEDSNV